MSTIMFQPTKFERAVGITLMGLLTAITSLLGPVVLLRGDSLFLVSGTFAMAVVFAGILFAYIRGWRYAPYLICGMLAILPGIFLETMTPAAVAASYVAPAVALIFLPAPWIILAGAVSILGLGLRTGAITDLNSTTVFINGVLVIGGLAIARQVLDEARRRSLTLAEEARTAQITAETANQSIAASNRQLQAQAEQQQLLIDLLNDLEIPAITIRDGVLLMPVLGNLDTRRASRLMDGVLAAVHQQRATLLIFDISGMTIADTASLHALNRTISATQLLGCEVTISGVRAEVAQALIQAQMTIPNVRFVQRLADAI